MSAARSLLPLLLAMLWLPAARGATPIAGTPLVSAEEMHRFVARHNPAFPADVARAFYEIGMRYNIRGDIALCQAVIETGWFRFDNGTAVRPEAHNYCGLGVGRRGDVGCSFASVEEGVTAMIQHLHAYATTGGLPDGETIVDPRFKYVSRGSAPHWEDLAGKWAANRRYADAILRIYGDLAASAGVTEVQSVEVAIPDCVYTSPETQKKAIKKKKKKAKASEPDYDDIYK